jgi:acyl-CoA synthetase (AMP-forming)/AMP-acid ligase II
MTEVRCITAAEILWDAAERFTELPCVTDLDADGGPLALSYGQVKRRAASVANAYTSLGLVPGDRVALLMPNGAAYVDAQLGASAASLVVVPLNVRLVGKDYLHMLTDSGSKLLITTGEFVERFPELLHVAGLRLLRADAHGGEASEFDVLVGSSPPISSPVRGQETDPASLMYTSGTTGSPKAVALSHRSWRAVAERAEQVLDMGEGEVTLHVAPLTHGAGFLLLPTLALGGHNLLCESFDATRSLRLFEEHGVTGLFVVPSMIRMLLDARPEGWSAPRSLRRLYYAGSPIDPMTLREATEAFQGRIVQSFAQMESPMFFTVLDRDDHLAALRDRDSPVVRSAGRVLPGVDLRIVNETGQPSGRGEPGEIVAKAPQTMIGYWNRPEATAESLVDGWLHTGDVGYLDSDGYLFIVDRIKDMIVTGGSNVYAREVEEVLIDLPGVKDAAVIGVPHRIWGEAVTAVLVPRGEPDSDAVVAWCRERLAGYKVPKSVVWVDELPRNAYGKVLKRDLRERLTNQQVAEAAG